MKKIILSVASITMAVVMALSFSACGKKETKEESTSAGISTNQSNAVINSTVKTNTNETEETQKITETTKESTTSTPMDYTESTNPEFMKNALFIGDSRTIGLAEYSGLPSDFFASVGMSVYNIHDKPISVPSVGKLTLTQLLQNKKYDKIYIMLGINEIGYNMDSTLKKYKSLVEEIRSYQADAVIFIQANLHVTKEKSDSDSYINNPNLDKFNSMISGLANGKDIFYINANTAFDDASGNLAEDKTSDKVHLYAKYYIQWARWIEIESKNTLI